MYRIIEDEDGRFVVHYTPRVGREQRYRAKTRKQADAWLRYVFAREEWTRTRAEWKKSMKDDGSASEDDALWLTSSFDDGITGVRRGSNLELTIPVQAVSTQAVKDALEAVEAHRSLTETKPNADGSIPTWRDFSEEEYREWASEIIEWRTALGREKYGDLFEGDPLQHLTGELLDALYYVFAARRRHDQRCQVNPPIELGVRTPRRVYRMRGLTRWCNDEDQMVFAGYDVDGNWREFYEDDIGHIWPENPRDDADLESAVCGLGPPPAADFDGLCVCGLDPTGCAEAGDSCDAFEPTGEEEPPDRYWRLPDKAAGRVYRVFYAQAARPGLPELDIGYALRPRDGEEWEARILTDQRQWKRIAYGLDDGGTARDIVEGYWKGRDCLPAPAEVRWERLHYSGSMKWRGISTDDNRMVASVVELPGGRMRAWVHHLDRADEIVAEDDNCADVLMTAVDRRLGLL